MTQGEMKSAIDDNTSRIDEIGGALKELKKRFERLERRLAEKEKTEEKEKKDIGYYIKRVRRNKFGSELVTTYLFEWGGDGNKARFCDNANKALRLNPDEVGIIIRGLLHDKWYSQLKTDYIDEWSFEIVEA